MCCEDVKKWNCFIFLVGLYNAATHLETILKIQKIKHGVNTWIYIIQYTLKRMKIYTHAKIIHDCPQQQNFYDDQNMEAISVFMSWWKKHANLYTVG